MPVVDAHIHAYPPAVFADPVRWGAEQREAWWTRCVAPPGRRSLQGWSTIDQLLRDMDAAGVDQVVMLGWYWERQATCDLQNAWFIDWHLAHPDRIQAFASVNPAAGAPAREALERALDAGLCGVGELLPQVQGGRLDDDDWSGVFALAAARGVPVNLHVTAPLSSMPESAMVVTPLDSYLQMIKAHQGTTFILAHWGGGLPFYELNSRLKPLFKNIYYDSAATSLLYDPSVFRRVVDITGPERILWGTDYPLLTHPRITKQPTFRHDLEDVRGAVAALTASELEWILGGNMVRLLRR
jgi:predicted TIM-barrel fold metal-dependent hydrolase